MPDDLTRDRLRREVGLFRSRESRRVFDTMVYVGRLGGPRSSFVARAQDLPALDAGLRVDVLVFLLDGIPGSDHEAWLTRAGVPEPHDEDVAWLAAALSAFAIGERRLEGFYVLTRTGWLDVRSGDRQCWRRLRL